MRVALRHVVFFAIGLTLGVGFLYTIRNNLSSSATITRLIDRGDEGSALASLACTPEMLEDDIFFVTCGGIY